MIIKRLSEVAPCPISPSDGATWGIFYDKWDIVVAKWDIKSANGLPVDNFTYLCLIIPILCHLLIMSQREMPISYKLLWTKISIFLVIISFSYIFDYSSPMHMVDKYQINLDFLF